MKLSKNQWEDCSDCPNQGWYLRQTSVRSYVTRDMALDAQIPELEGSLYTDDEWEQEQCEFCWTNSKSVFYQENKLWKK